MKEQNQKLVEVKIPSISTGAEETLSVIASLVLALGILLTLVLLFTVVFIKDPISYRGDFIFNANGFALCIGTLLSTLVTGAVLRVFVNISLRLKAIQETMPLKQVDEMEMKAAEAKEKKKKTAANQSGQAITVGDTVTNLTDGKQYEVLDANGRNEIYINLGFIGGCIWLTPDKYKKG